MTTCDVRVLPAVVHVELIVIEPADFCRSRLEHSRCELTPARDCIIWSVAASTHCRMTCFGILVLGRVVSVSHKPGLRAGNSADHAAVAKNIITKNEVALKCAMRSFSATGQWTCRPTYLSDVSETTHYVTALRSSFTAIRAIFRMSAQRPVSRRRGLSASRTCAEFMRTRAHLTKLKP